MNILITAGATVVPIDQVRQITNIFKGRTGHQIARELQLNKHNITLITSNPDTVYEPMTDSKGRLNVINYKTFDELHNIMKSEINQGNYDVVIHSAAVSDYKVEGAYTLEEELAEDGDTCRYEKHMSLLDNSKKISSDYDELYLKLVKTPKIISKIRDEWNFKGKLISFKLLVDVSDEELIRVAMRSLKTNKCDAVIANCLEWSRDYAIIVDKDNSLKIDRSLLSLKINKLCEK